MLFSMPTACRGLAVGLLSLALLAGCATRPPGNDPEAVAEFEETNDPAEPFNRAMYDVHQVIDKTVLKPVAQGYRAVVPQPVREGVSNVLGNLRTPIILVNDLLQGQLKRAGDTSARFLINTTAGIGGIFDVAGKRFGIPAHSEDWGQTMAVWGIKEGPYLFLPVLGPSNPRDLTGFGLGIATDPFTWVGQGVAVMALTTSRGGMSVVDTREGLIEPLDAIDRESLDSYAFIRSAYRQRRNAEIKNQLDKAAGARATGTGFGAGAGAPATR